MRRGRDKNIGAPSLTLVSKELVPQNVSWCGSKGAHHSPQPTIYNRVTFGQYDYVYSMRASSLAPHLQSDHRRSISLASHVDGVYTVHVLYRNWVHFDFALRIFPALSFCKNMPFTVFVAELGNLLVKPPNRQYSSRKGTTHQRISLAQHYSRISSSLSVCLQTMLLL